MGVTSAVIAQTLQRLESEPLAVLLSKAYRLSRDAHGDVITFSPKVFIPLTQLCRDVCGYCTFARPPRRGERAFMSREEILAVARMGVAAGCTEALFTLGEFPEERYRLAGQELASLGYSSTIDYLVAMAGVVLSETGLLPHVNAGVMPASDMARLRTVSASQGLMLESTSQLLFERGGPHYGSPGKKPEIRVAMLAEAGRQAIPFTTGILVGIGESRADRVESLLTIRDLHQRYGHIQEVIVQNFQPKVGTRMAAHPAPAMDDFLWTVAAARLVLGPEMNIQAPPNLSHDRFPELLGAGINDWGGVSPVTPDHVNPEAAWPALENLRAATGKAGFVLVPRLPLYPRYISSAWLDPSVQPQVLRASDAEGFGRDDCWSPGLAVVPCLPSPGLVRGANPGLERTIARTLRGERLEEPSVAALFSVRAGDFEMLTLAADELRASVNGGDVRYVVNRNINYTNICAYHCTFCAFSKGKTADKLRGHPYLVDLGEVERRTAEAWERGATEVCMQGGIHPNFSGQTYLDLLAAAKRGARSIHVHAFSPLEVTHGASTLGVPVRDFLKMLRDAGLGSLPGTAAEILDDDARAILCPDKLTAAGWLEVVGTAHEIGLPTTSTIMFGHVDHPTQWARHLLSLRDLQARTGGITEFVPLPFVHMEAPLFFKGRARKGPTFRETVLMHAVARLVLHPLIRNVQVSWVKLGAEGVKACLRAGANDLGGTLMNESISRAAGTQHGQELPPEAMDEIISSIGRRAGQRTTLYSAPQHSQIVRSYGAADLAPLVTGAILPRSRQSASVPAIS